MSLYDELELVREANALRAQLAEAQKYLDMDVVDAYLTALDDRQKAIKERDAALERVRELSQAEQDYRHAHDLYGGADIRTGRAWDVMRKSGDKARSALAYGEGGE